MTFGKPNKTLFFRFKIKIHIYTNAGIDEPDKMSYFEEFSSDRPPQNLNLDLNKHNEITKVITNKNIYMLDLISFIREIIPGSKLK